MMNWRALAAAALITAALVPLQAAAQNLLTNGSFEGGSLAGWTQVESGPFSPGNCDFESLTPPNNTAGFGGFLAPLATDGTFSLVTDAFQPGTCQLFQDVVLPTGNATLTYAAGYNVNVLGAPGALNCDASVVIADTGNVPLVTGYTLNGGATGGAPDPMAVRPPLSVHVAPGTTVRVLLTADSCDAAPAGIVADNFVLLAGPAGSASVPTLDGWAKLALMLAVISAGAIYRRRA